MATPVLNYGTLDELESTYAQLMRTEPPTREEELKRQYRLDALREVLAAAYQNLDACVGGHTFWGQRLPTNEEERREATQARTRIAEIDHELASRK